MEVILDNDNLLRRVPFVDPNYVKDDGTLTSCAFQLKKGAYGLSVNVERLTTYHDSIQDIHRFRLYYLKAQQPRELGLECVHDPQPANNAHALIKGEITKKISRELAKSAKRIAYPD